MSKITGKCYRCPADIKTGLPPAGMSWFSAKVQKFTWLITFSRIRMNSWNDAPTAADTIASTYFTDVELCDSCWGDVLNFICTTRRTAK